MKAHRLICWATKPTVVQVYRNPINWEIEGKGDKIARCWESSFRSFNRKDTFEPYYSIQIGTRRHTHTHNVYVHVCNYIHEIVHLHRFYFACIIQSIKMFNIFNMEMFKTGVHVEIYLLILALPRQQWWYHQTALLSCATSHINSFRTHYNSEFYLSLNNISITQ